jgi:DNA topoisomerase-2
MHIPDRYIKGKDEFEDRVNKEIEYEDKAKENDMTLDEYREKEGIPYEALQGIIATSDNGRWEVIVAYNPSDDFQQVSFVNSIATVKAGKHVDLVKMKITETVREKLVKEAKKSNIRVTNIKNEHIESELFVFVKCLIENPSFDSQSKECLKSKISDFGSEFDYDEEFVNSLHGSGIITSVLAMSNATQKSGINERLDKLFAKDDGPKETIYTFAKRQKIIVPKLEDANLAGTTQSMECTLILTEGDSAKALAVAGLGVIGRDKYGVFPLKGKPLNVRDREDKDIFQN